MQLELKSISNSLKKTYIFNGIILFYYIIIINWKRLTNVAIHIKDL